MNFPSQLSSKSQEQIKVVTKLSPVWNLAISNLIIEFDWKCNPVAHHNIHILLHIIKPPYLYMLCVQYGGSWEILKYFSLPMPVVKLLMPYKLSNLVKDENYINDLFLLFFVNEADIGISNWPSIMLKWLCD